MARAKVKAKEESMQAGARLRALGRFGLGPPRLPEVAGFLGSMLAAEQLVSAAFQLAYVLLLSRKGRVDFQDGCCGPCNSKHVVQDLELLVTTGNKTCTKKSRSLEGSLSRG